MPKDPSEMVADRVVEVYSAANAIEAQGLCALLEEEGIRAQIVGEQLGSAAGCLPLGEALAPRIWVREDDVEQARGIIQEWISQPDQQWNWPDEGDQQSELEEEPEDEAPRASHGRFYWLGRVFVIAGVACILIGAVWAWQTWMTMREYQGIAEAMLVGGQSHSEHYVPPYDDNIPGPHRRAVFSTRYELKYGFVVDGKIYHTVTQNGNPNDRRTQIYYDLHDPERNVVGPLAQPWMILLSTWGIGAFLSFLGYRYL